MAAFTAGDIVVYRVGAAGGAALSSAATAVFLDEIKPDGTLVQSIALPTADGGGQHALTASGSAGSEGLLTLSADGRYLLLTGYDAATGAAGVATSATVARDVGRFGADASLDTSTVLSGLGGNNIRSVASPDGVNLYIGHASQGVDYTTLGAATVTSLTTGVANARQVEVAGGQLYYDTGSTGGAGLGVGVIGSGLPTTAGQTATILAGTGTTPAGTSPYAFYLADLSPTVAGYDTLYVADSGTGKGIEKFTLSGGAWMLTGTIALAGVEGLTATLAGSTATLYATTPTGLYKVVDATGYGVAPTATAGAALVAAATNTAFRGVAFAPTPAAPVDTTPPTLASTAPTENATGVAAGASIVLTFSEAVKAGTGNITLVDTADASRNVVIAVGSGQVTFNGATVTIQPTAALHAGDAYHVSVDGTAVSDLAGNAYMGGADVLDFTTAPPAGGFPTGSQANTFAVTAAGTYTLPAGQTFTETGANVAVTATDTAAALTALDIEGALTGAAGKRGVVETVPNGQLTVGAAGSLHTTDADAFQFVQPAGGGGQASVTNLGSIVSASTIATPNTAGMGTTAHGYGLNFNAATGAAGATDHTSGGTVANGSAANAAAVIESDSDDAVRLGSNQTLTNYGQILGKGPVDDSASNNGLKPGGSTTNVYDSSRGVEINGHAHDTVDNFGRIEGAQHGVDAGDVADSDITVVNEADGVIVGHNGSGVGSDGATANDVNAGDVTVTNAGQIYGEYRPTFDRSGAATTDGDGDGVDIDGAGTVLNKAGAIIAGAGVDANGNPVLNGQGAGGYDSNGRLNHSEGLSLGGGAVDNFGTISGADYGITVNNDGVASRSGVASTQITNEVGGTITGQNGYAIRLENKGADALDTDTITNHGAITGTGTIPAATGTATIEGGAADPNTVGTLNGVAYTAGGANTNRFVSGDGAAIQTGEGNDAVFNDGVITGTNGRAISLEGGDDTLTLSAAGTVSGTIDGGVGTDTLNLTAGATGAQANTLTDVVNFEVLNLQHGAWTLTDAESFTTATVSAGATLQLGAGGTAGVLAAAIADNGTLVVDHSDAVILGATVTAGNTGVLSQIGAGVTTLAAAHNFAGVTLAAGVLDVGATGTTAAVTFAPAGGATPTLRVETAATAAGAFAPTVKGFAAGDAIDVTGVGAGAVATLGAGNVLTVAGAGGTETVQLDPNQSFAGKAFATAADAGGTGVNVTLTTAPATAGLLYSQTFDGYTASGLNPGGTGGALDSNVFRVSGLNGPTTSNYGDTSTAADYARGLLAVTADPSSAGLYSGVTANSGPGDHALLIQPTGAEFDVNGFVEMRVQNTTANAVTGLSLAFNWVYHNNEARADNLALAYSTDGVNFTVAPSANLSTPAAASIASPVPFTYVQENVTLPAGAVVAPGAYVYFRFEHLSSATAGSRDEVGVDNVAVSYSGVSHTPVLSVSNVSANEGNSGTTPFTFTVTRAGDLSAATTVHYATADGTANAGSDYTAVSGDLTFAPGDTTKTVTVLVNGDTVQEPNETFTLNLSNPVNATLPTTPATGTILNDDTSITSVGDIQGAATTSPFVGQTVTTTGVVTYIKTGAGGGYYIQDPTTAGPAGASHGLFVFSAATPAVAVGDAVTVSGVVTEFAAQANDRPTTELNSPMTTVVSHGNAVTPVVIGAGGILPPTATIAGPTYDPVHNGVDFYESLEGQLVTIHNAQATDATFSGSTWVVADLGAEATGINARGGITSSAGDFDPERIQVYSTALSASMGEHLGDITGVISYYNGEYELIPTQPVTPPGNGATTPPFLPLETTTLKGDASHLAIAAYNVENLGPVQPGVAQATVDARFAALGSDIAHNLGGPAIVGLEEIQDSNGENPNTPPAANDPNYAADYAAYQTSLNASVTLTKLTGAISTAGGPAYSYVEVPPTATNVMGGAPDGNIRPAILYDPTKVSYVAGSAHLIADPDLSNGDAFANSRMPLAAQFTFNGQTINVIEIHDYARSGSEELFGQDQPAMNSGDQKRVDQTAAVNAYVNQLLAADPSARIVVQGDFNGFQFEPTLTQLAHSGGGQLNQLSDLLPANERYSTTFEGISQEIDHALVSDSLDAGAQFDIVHLNTGQPAAAQASDHDPIISLLSVPGAATSPVNTPPAVTGTHASTTGDRAADALFSGVTVADPDTGQTETATISFTAANGALTGAGAATTANGVATYTVSAASASALTAALQAVTFQPTAAPAGTPSTSTPVSLSVSDGVASTAADTGTVITATHTTNTPPAVTGTHASTTGDRAADALFSGVTVADPDTGQTETATISFTAANGALTGAGAATTANGMATYTVSAGSAQALTTALQAVTFRPTAKPLGTPSTATAVTLSVSDGVASTAADTGTVITATHTTDTAPTFTGTHASTTSDRAADALFSGVTVADPDTGQTETATISFAAANGTLTGAGAAALANGMATYTVSAASAQALTTALQTVLLQPTAAPAGTAATSTVVSLSVSDGVVSTAVDAGTVVSATHTTDTPPALGGVPAAANAPSGGSVVLAPGLTVTDPDAGASALSATVAITAGFTAGDVLTATPAAGIKAAYDAARGVLTLTGPASDAAYAAALASVSFSHDGAVDAGARTVQIGVTDDQGVASSPASETVNVAALTPPATGGGAGAGGGGGASGSTNLDVQLGFALQLGNLALAATADVGFGSAVSPLYALAQAEKAIAAQLDAGQLGVADAQAALYHLVDGTTSVAEISYAFFTGKTPTAAGLDYLVNSPANPNDLNDAYYAKFTTENRYINFANNLATGAGAGAAAFQAAYGGLSLADATSKAYAAVFGVAPTADKVSAILNTPVSNGLGGTETRAQYFADITGGSAISQKAAVAGFLLADSVKEGFGAYQQADLHFLQDLAHGSAVFNVDLLAAYSQAPALVGQPVAEPTLGS